MEPAPAAAGGARAEAERRGGRGACQPSESPKGERERRSSDAGGPKSVRFKDVTASDICPVCPTAASSSSGQGSGPLAATVAPGRASESSRAFSAAAAGDAAALQALLAEGCCDPRARDASGHTVLWRLIALGHAGMALAVVERFPFDAEGGADAAELHPLQRDTLLHLLCRVKPFGAEAAELFARAARRLAAGPLLASRNAAGESFLDLAAGAANFWVLRFALGSLAAACKPLLPGASTPPLRALHRRLPKPRLPPEPRLQRWPLHLDFARSLAPEPSTGVPLYSDLAFEVGSDAPGASASAPGRPCGRSLLLAHSAVMASRSPVLMEELRGRSAELLPGLDGVSACLFRVDPRIPKEVWKCVMQFCYTGQVSPGLLHDVPQLSELVRACLLYQLPTPLLEFAQAALVPVFPSAATHALLEASAYWLLQSAHEVCKHMDPEETSALLRRILKAVEAGVFR